MYLVNDHREITMIDYLEYCSFKGYLYILISIRCCIVYKYISSDTFSSLTVAKLILHYLLLVCNISSTEVAVISMPLSRV